jgi:hypothetical protein
VSKLTALMNHRVNEQIALTLTPFRLRVWQYLALTVLSFAALIAAAAADNTVLSTTMIFVLTYWFVRFYLAGWHFRNRS